MRKHTRSAPRLAVILPGYAVLAGALLATPVTTWAQKTPDVAARAKASYELGMAAYERGHYDGAIESFTRAHALDPAPILLYNIAQAHFKKGDNEQALLFYRRYLDAEPSSQHRGKLEERIRELETARPAIPPTPAPASPFGKPAEKEAEKLAAKPPPVPAVSLLGSDLVLASPPRVPLYRRPWFWPAVGAAGMVVMASIFLLRPDQPAWNCGRECLSTREIPAP
jgi:tetratricopeptide (TPR) repeat protein